MRFYGLHPSADLSNAWKAIEDALNGLMWEDDVQLVCVAAAHKLPADVAGPRVELEAWATARSAA